MQTNVPNRSRFSKFDHIFQPMFSSTLPTSQFLPSLPSVAFLHREHLHAPGHNTIAVSLKAFSAVQTDNSVHVFVFHLRWVIFNYQMSCCGRGRMAFHCARFWHAKRGRRHIVSHMVRGVWDICCNTHICFIHNTLRSLIYLYGDLVTAAAY